MPKDEWNAYDDDEGDFTDDEDTDDDKDSDEDDSFQFLFQHKKIYGVIDNA